LSKLWSELETKKRRVQLFRKPAYKCGKCRRPPQDRRKVIVSLVPDKAYEDMVSLFEILTQHYDPVIQNYSNDELSVIYRFMRDSNQAVKDTISTLREGETFDSPPA